MKEALVFWESWVYADLVLRHHLLDVPLLPAVLNFGWERLTLFEGGEKGSVLERLWLLKDLGLIGPMIMKEYLRQWVAPLSKRSHPHGSSGECQIALGWFHRAR